MNRQTTLANYKKNEVPRDWWVVDATDQILGRLSVKIARILMGKTKPEYTPHHDAGDFVVVVNCEKVRVTGQKLEQKHHERFTGHPSGRKLESWGQVLENKPEELIREAVRRMLPKNKLARQQLSKLKIYVGADHPHQAQQPQTLEL